MGHDNPNHACTLLWSGLDWVYSRAMGSDLWGEYWVIEICSSRYHFPFCMLNALASFFILRQ